MSRGAWLDAKLTLPSSDVCGLNQTNDVARRTSITGIQKDEKMTNSMGSDQDKADKPHAHFDTAHEVVVDPVLSKEQKIEALKHLEQDARQLAVASSEGMSGGEETALQEVLHAKDLIELPPVTQAYEVVLKDLQDPFTSPCLRASDWVG